MSIGYQGYGEDVKILNDLLTQDGFKIGPVQEPDESEEIIDIA